MWTLPTLFPRRGVDSTLTASSFSRSASVVCEDEAKGDERLYSKTLEVDVGRPRPLAGTESWSVAALEFMTASMMLAVLEVRLKEFLPFLRGDDAAEEEGAGEFVKFFLEDECRGFF